MLGSLSYRFKIPLAITAAILLTALALALTSAVRTYESSRRQLFVDAERIGALLADTLTDQIRKDAVWSAYLSVQTLASVDSDTADSPVVVVLDALGRVFVSGDPERFPLLAPGAELITGADARSQDSEHLVVRVPIAPDGELLGEVLLLYPRSRLLPPLYDIVTGTLWTLLAVLAVVLPVAWFWGRSLAAPLVHLAESMPKVTASPPQPVDLPLVASRDEIGRLTERFRAMLADLAEKREMERHMVATERLAAIGRVAAGVAHEINNPLGGMLNALSTYRRHGGEQPRLSEKTVSLLERGLQQIRETVAALLVEAKLETHPLTPEDIEDVRTLVLPEVKKKHARLDWSSDLAAPMALPSTQVRQVLLNLLLNAIKAVGREGKVACSVRASAHALRITVEDDGAPIARPEAERLFEPFSGTDADANGLGLWVTYQIVQQFDGRISVDNQPGMTRFRVSLPAAG